MIGTSKARRELIYLACPYTHPDPSVRLYRFQQATKAAAALIRQGHIVFSPITMTHPIDIEMAGAENTLGSDFWVTFDESFMDRCDVFALLPLAGWQDSGGIRREIAYFKARGKPLKILDQTFQLKTYELPLTDNQKELPLKGAR
jgi:nucleoside 2-deoxyribosyltransferase